MNGRFTIGDLNELLSQLGFEKQPTDDIFLAKYQSSLTDITVRLCDMSIRIANDVEYYSLRDFLSLNVGAEAATELLLGTPDELVKSRLISAQIFAHITIVTMEELETALKKGSLVPEQVIDGKNKYSYRQSSNIRDVVAMLQKY